MGGRYTTSKPILAMRGNAFVAVANVPCDRVALLVPASGRPGKQFVPGAEAGRRPIHPDAVLLAAGDLVAQRILRQQLGDLGGQGGTRAGERVARLTQQLGGLDERVAQCSGHAGGGALQQSCADDQVVGQLGFTLTRVELGGDGFTPGRDRVAPAVDPERSTNRPGRGETAVKNVGRSTGVHGAGRG